MRKTILASVCAAIIGMSAIAAASAQTSGAPARAPADNQTNVTAPKTTDNMNAMNKTKKKSKMKKSTKDESGMEKK